VVFWEEGWPLSVVNIGNALLRLMARQEATKLYTSDIGRRNASKLTTPEIMLIVCVMRHSTGCAVKPCNLGEAAESGLRPLVPSVWQSQHLSQVKEHRL